MDILEQIKEIDKNTGDVNQCLQILKRHKAKYKDSYYKYKQYWILVYFCDMEIDTFDQCLELPESQRVKIISKASPKYLKLFSTKALAKLLKLPDQDLYPLIEELWKLLPQKLIIKRILQASDPEKFFDLKIKISSLEDLDFSDLPSLTLLLTLSTPELLPKLLDRFYALLTQDFLSRFVSAYSTQGSLELSGTLQNFRVIKCMMLEEGRTDFSVFFYHTLQNVLSEFMAPPCVAHKLLPRETGEILDGMGEKELKMTKEFVFGKMIAADIKAQLGGLLHDRGVDCKEEMELTTQKLKYIEELPEEIAVELLISRSFEQVNDIIIGWKKEEIGNFY